MPRKKGIKLCIYTLARTRDLSNIPGNIIKETLEYGRVFERVTLVHFHKNLSRRGINSKVRVLTIPHIDPNTPIKFGLHILTSYFLSLPIILGLTVTGRTNLLRADDLIITGLPCVIASKISKSRVIVSMHGDLEEVVRIKMGTNAKTLKYTLKILEKISRYVLANSDACMVVNKKLEIKARNLGAKETFLIHPNIDLSLFSQTRLEPRGSFTVLFVGRLEPEKGPLNVLLVAERMKFIDFCIVGYGPLYDEMHEWIVRKNLTNVKLMGPVAHNDLPKFYNMAEVLLLPSYSEGLPIVMLEAMASQLPVIVSDVGGVRDTLQNTNGGYVVTPGNIEEIVDKIQLLIENVDLRKELGKKGRSNVLNNFQNFTGKQIQLYNKVVNTHD